MLDLEHIKILEDIAFNPTAKPLDRIAACSSLLKENTNTKWALGTLNDIASSEKTKNADRVKAVNLINKFNAETNQASASQEELDLAKKNLEMQYLGNKKT